MTITKLPTYRNPAVAILRTREDYIEQVRTHLAKSAENAFEAGKVLLEARAKLDRQQFLEMLQDSDFPVSESTAYRLMEVAGNEVLLGFAHAQKLPTSWYSLYELGRLQAKLSAPRFQKLIEDGTINPKMERKDIARLQPKKKQSAAKYSAKAEEQTTTTTAVTTVTVASDLTDQEQQLWTLLDGNVGLLASLLRKRPSLRDQITELQLFEHLPGLVAEEEAPRSPLTDLECSGLTDPSSIIPENYSPPTVPTAADMRTPGEIMGEMPPELDRRAQAELDRRRQRRVELAAWRDHGNY
jgi:hypothetical protein